MKQMESVQTTGVKNKDYIIITLGGLLTLALIPNVLKIYMLIDKLFYILFDIHPGAMPGVGNVATETAKFLTLIPLGAALGLTNRARDAKLASLLVFAACIVGAVFGYYEYQYYQDVLWKRVLLHMSITGSGVGLMYLHRNMTNHMMKKPIPLRRMLGSGLEQAIGNYLFLYLTYFLLL